MPQMMPLNWIILFFYFLMIFMLFNIILYFNFKNYKNSMIKNKYTFKLNWKW
uniref:ATP synthase complex subunit 8 n=1 Tax=Scymninae sp. 4 ACP-2013 TaxID=1434585 RepID=A0A3G3FX00_9CUCU|nr:ATP synthase F0 subunit 8 [Scymninae sp. 4 ACP-2013]